MITTIALVIIALAQVTRAGVQLLDYRERKRHNRETLRKMQLMVETTATSVDLQADGISLMRGR